MRRTPRIALVLMALTAGVPRAEGSAKVPVSTSYELVYAQAGDTELKLDLARPAEGKGPFPGVLVIHGGGWAQGNKSDMRPLLNELASRGYVAVSPQYRFSPKVPFPAQVHDVKAAVRWLKGHATEYKVDAGHIGAMGFSAGGHLALMLGMTGPADGLEGDAPRDAPDSKIQAVVNYFGPTDLGAADFPVFTRHLIDDFLGRTPAERSAAVAQASPVTHASKGDAPVLTLQGTSDPLVPHNQAVKLAEALTKAGVPGRVELLQGASHGWGGEENERTSAATIAFLDKYLK